MIPECVSVVSGMVLRPPAEAQTSVAQVIPCNELLRSLFLNPQCPKLAELRRQGSCLLLKHFGINLCSLLCAPLSEEHMKGSHKLGTSITEVQKFPAKSERWGKE